MLKSKVVEISFKDSQIQARSDYNADKGVTTSTTGTIILESRPLGATSKIIGRQEKSKPTNATYSFVPLGTYVTEFYFNRNKSDEFLSTEINLKEGDTIRLLADFYDGKIINKTEYRVTFISAEDELGILTIDDQKYGKLPNEIFLPVGNHHIVYEPSILKYGTFDQVVHIEESQLYKINLKVERFPVTFLLPEDAQGELYSDGNLLVGSLSGKKTVWMKPGSHKIEFISSNQRYKTFSSVMNISPEDQIWLPLERDKYLITIYNQTPFSGKISVNGVSQGILQQNKSVSMYTSLGKHTITLNHDNAEYEPIKRIYL